MSYQPGYECWNVWLKLGVMKTQDRQVLIAHCRFGCGSGVGGNRFQDHLQEAEESIFIMPSVRE